jgi:hypothetical protein
VHDTKSIHPVISRKTNTVPSAVLTQQRCVDL